MSPKTLTVQKPAQKEIQKAISQPAQRLLLYRLRCPQTANGLSHYYMYGDIAPNETIL